MLLQKFKKHHDAYIVEWVQAEEVLKLVERIKGEVFIPSIMELRYAARRIVQAHVDFNAGNTTDDCLETHFIEAIENCKKARHDAIDSAIAFIDDQYTKLTDTVGLLLITRGFPQYPEFRKEMRKIDTLVVESRKNRNGLNSSYETIKKEHLEKMVDLYFEMESSKEVIDLLRKKERKDFWISIVTASFVIGIVVALIITFADKRGLFDWMKAQPASHTITEPLTSGTTKPTNPP
jgi:hypothetical protein